MPYILSYADGRKILELAGVREELHRIAAEQVLPKAASLAAASKLPEFASSLRVEDGVRPKGRPYARVVADFDDAEKFEYGDSKTQRYRILGRAAGVKVWSDT